MRNLEFFASKGDYEHHIWSTVFTEPWVRQTPFYRNLVQYIMDWRTPIFYTVSDSSEHFAFSGAYYFETRRTRYPNRTREQLFWLHDFTHMLQDFWYQERIASSETEVLAYYRVPGLRERVFPDEKLWYDVIREQGWAVPYPGAKDRIPITGDQKPDAARFLDYRIRIQMEDEFGQQELGDHPEILKFIQKWRRLTPNWISKRYRSVAGMRVEAPQYPRNFTAENYEAKISNYHREQIQRARADQGQYERNIMANVRMAYDLLQWEGKPERWRHIPEAIDRLEGAVLFK
jgi:hypothetical protein